MSPDRASVTLSAVTPHSNKIPLVFTCDIERFYPEEASVSWLHNGTVLPDPPATEHNPDRTFTTRRYYTLDPELREQGGKVECVVSQPGLLQPVSASVNLQSQGRKGMVLILESMILLFHTHMKHDPFGCVLFSIMK